MKLRTYVLISLWLGLMGAWPLAPWELHDQPWQEAGPWLALDWGAHLVGIWMGVAFFIARYQAYERNRVG